VRASKLKGKAKSAVMQRKYRMLVEEPQRGKKPYRRPPPGRKLDEQ